MKLTENELFELKYHYVDRVVDNMFDAVCNAMEEHRV